MDNFSGNKNSSNLTMNRALDAAVHFHQIGDLTKAQNLYQQILQLNPDHPIALHLLGVVAYQAGRNDIATELIEKAIKIKSNFDEAHNNLGNVFKSVGRLQDAVKQYKIAIKINSKIADYFYNMAIALEKLEQSNEAVYAYQQALTLNTNNPSIYFNLANVYRSIGKFDDAIKNYRKSISINPKYAEAFRQIASIKKFAVGDDDLVLMQQLIVQPDTNPNQIMHLAFAIGKAYEDIKDFDQSFEYFEKANILKRKEFNLDINNWDLYVNRLISVFDRELFSQQVGAGYRGKGAIFILGMPRSGTSLIEQILASHVDVFGAGEIQTLSNVYTSLFELSQFPENILQAQCEDFERLGERYLQLMKNSTNALYVTNKMPDNFKVIGMIKLMLPNAKIIHCKRNPVDNCLSIYKNYFSSKDLSYAYDQEELAKYYNGYLTLMSHWKNLLPDFIYDIQYEDLVANQENETRALLKFCGLKWDQGCLKFHQTSRQVKTASATQVRKPVYTNSVHLWKNYESHLGPMLRHLQLENSDGPS